MQPILLFKNTISTLPFKIWLRQDVENKLLLAFSIIGMAISFAWLKIIYPYPNFMPPDSNSYIEAAYTNQFINVWPIGYSKFLRFVSSFTSSHFILALLQYLMLMACLFYFLFTIRYLLSPTKWLFRILIFVSVFNPLVPHISNFISTDALFTALSLLWFTQLLWLIYKPDKRLIFSHAFILLFAFMVRFNALYYPFITMLVLLYTNMPIKIKIIAISFIALLLCIFIGRTQYEYFKKTKTVQYSAFGGWQMAANALYGYAYVKPDPVDSVPWQFRKIHSIVNRHMDSLRHLLIRPDDEVAIYYLWDFKSPLRVYMNEKWRKDTANEYLVRWASMAPLYSDYGKYIIKKHPSAFIKYYLWPNLLKYYAPPPKFMGSYNLGKKSVPSATAKWFGWKNNKLPTLDIDRKIQIAEAFPVLTAIINLVFVFGFIAFGMLSGFTECSSYNKSVLCWTMTIWLSNMIFSVLAAPIELRYQLFPFIITTNFMFLFIAFIVEKNRVNKPDANHYSQTQPITKTVIQ